MKRNIIIALCVLVRSFILGQEIIEKTDSVQSKKIFVCNFELNATDINRETKLDEINQESTEKWIVDSIKLISYTDTLGATDYNFKLATVRINYIKDSIVSFLNFKNKREFKIQSFNRGEDNFTRLSDDQKRRVEIIIYYKSTYFETLKPGLEATVYFNTNDTTFQNMGNIPKKDSIILRKAYQTNIQFLAGTTQISYPSYPELAMIAQVLRDRPNLTAELHGHVCCSNEKRNSKKRAKRVRTVLCEAGIIKKRLKIFGHGNTIPLAVEDTQENMQKNRRVEIVFFDLKAN